MRSFKDYTPPEGNGDASSATELTKKLAAAWSGKPSGEMLMQILREAEKSKKSGKLKNEEIDEFYEQFAPLLDGAQKRRLQAVVERLKSL